MSSPLRNNPLSFLPMPLKCPQKEATNWAARFVTGTYKEKNIGSLGQLSSIS
jgi:hypothetical protein